MSFLTVFFATCISGMSFLPFNSEVQKVDPNPAIVSIPEMSWKTEYQDNRIKIESAVYLYLNDSKGIKHQRIIFRYTNLTSTHLKLSFGRKIIYNGVCYGCENSDKRFTVELNALEAKEFSAENKDKTYYLFSKDLTNTITKTLDSFDLTAIETTL